MLDIGIAGIGYYVPEKRLTNQEVVERYLDDFTKNLNQEDAEFLQYSFKRKLDFLEIESRSYCEDIQKENSIVMSVHAAKDALKHANLEPEEIELVLFTGVCNPFREPSYAIILADQLKIRRGNYFDIGDACNGFLKALELASLYIKGGKAKNVLVVTCESTLEMLDRMRENLHVNSVEEADYKMNLLFAGTGAAAFVLTQDQGKRSVVAYSEQRDSSAWDISFYVSPKILMPSKKMNDLDFTTWGDGRKIAAMVIEEMPEFVLHFMEENHIESVKYIFCHQLGRNITYAILNKIHADIDKMFPINTFKTCGNMGSANIPVSLALAEERGMLEKGDSILLLGSSCGLTYSAAHVIW